MNQNSAGRVQPLPGVFPDDADAGNVRDFFGTGKRRRRTEAVADTDGGALRRGLHAHVPDEQPLELYLFLGVMGGLGWPQPQTRANEGSNGSSPSKTHTQD